MEVELKIVRGPLTTGFTREAAAEKLKSLDGFPENAKFEIYEADGRYMAAVAWPKEAGPFPPSDDSGEAPSGPPSGPPSDESSEDSGPPSDSEGGDEKSEGDEPSSEGAPKEDGKGEHGVEHMLANLTDMLTKITDALGLSTPADGMIPGPDDGAVPPPGPPGEGKPGDSDPTTPGKQGPDGKIHTVHERSLKPGEAPPGTTPVGAPAFASVDAKHPWKDAIEARVREFEVESEIGDAPLSSVASELKGLADPHGYTVTDLSVSGGGSTRTASARIVRTR
jgi:hypothetical protein